MRETLELPVWDGPNQHGVWCKSHPAVEKIVVYIESQKKPEWHWNNKRLIVFLRQDAERFWMTAHEDQHVNGGSFSPLAPDLRTVRTRDRSTALRGLLDQMLESQAVRMSGQWGDAESRHAGRVASAITSLLAGLQAPIAANPQLSLFEQVAA